MDINTIADPQQDVTAKPGGWLKLYRNGEKIYLLLRHPIAHALLTLIAIRTRYQEGGIDPRSGDSLNIGEALVGRGDSEKIGATPKQYRVALDQLCRWKIVAILRATSGANGGTIVKIIDSSIYEVVPLPNGQLKGHLEGQYGAIYIDHIEKTSRGNSNAIPDRQNEQEEAKKIMLAERAMWLMTELANTHFCFSELQEIEEQGLVEGIKQGLQAGLAEGDLLALGHYSARDGIHDPICYFLRGCRGAYGKDPVVWVTKHLSHERKKMEKEKNMDIKVQRFGAPRDFFGPSTQVDHAYTT